MAEPALEWRDLKNRSDIHWARKIWHMVTVFGMFAVYQMVTPTTAMVILSVAYLIFIPFDFLRLRYPQLNQFALIIMGPLMRTHEAKQTAGTTYLLTGVTLIVLVFPKPIVALSILFLAFADPLASYVGLRYGKDKILGNKTIQGFLAAFAVCTILAFLYLWSHEVGLSRRLVVSFLAGFIGAMAELLPVAKLDDNLTMPVLSATGLWLVFQLFGLTFMTTSEGF